MNTASRELLRLTGVTKVYDARSDGAPVKLRALDSIDLSVQSREIVGCMGESGCGKSTLARLIVRLEIPTSGDILFDGQDLSHLDSRATSEFRQRVQMVFQDPYSALAPRMRIGDAIQEPLRIFKVGDAATQQRRVHELLEMVGLPASIAVRYPHQLSGGQRQRINIARALALKPEMLILDEPVSALDVSIQAQVINLLRDLQRNLGLTMIFISHDLRIVKYLCDTVAVMYLGRVVEYGRSEEIFAGPGHPYTLALLHSIPDHSLSGGGGRARLHGEVPSPIDIPSGCAFHTRCPMAQDICRRERPLLRPIGASSRQSACHFAEQVGAAGDQVSSLPTSVS